MASARIALAMLESEGEEVMLFRIDGVSQGRGEDARTLLQGRTF
jgi:hypothetical protein